MAPPSRSSASWERVLAAVEADAARAAALLISDDASASAGIEYDGHDAAPASTTSADDATGVPATWRLPVPVSGIAARGPGLTGGAAARAVAGYAAATGSAAAASVTAGAAPSIGTVGTGTTPASTAGLEPAPTRTGPAGAFGATPTPAGTFGTGPVPAGTAGTDPTPAAARAADTDITALPDPADMPPMTPEQQQRFAALHTRITELQGQLAAAMAEAESVLARTPARRPDPQPRPELVDRRL